MTDKKQ
jgi:hypothetical protein